MYAHSVVPDFFASWELHATSCECFIYQISTRCSCECTIYQLSTRCWPVAAECADESQASDLCKPQTRVGMAFVLPIFENGVLFPSSNKPIRFSHVCTNTYEHKGVYTHAVTHVNNKVFRISTSADTSARIQTAIYMEILLGKTSCWSQKTRTQHVPDPHSVTVSLIYIYIYIYIYIHTHTHAYT